jgi:hypothetical protein
MKKLNAEALVNVARVTRTGNLVVNIEIANDSWLKENHDDPFFTFVPTPDGEGNEAEIGSYYSQELKQFEKLLIGPVA